jgi:hypothetical protein
VIALPPVAEEVTDAQNSGAHYAAD